jgi:glycosyltransferase involved in cell wall biosynthesis
MTTAPSTPVSAVIITYNEERNLLPAIESVSFCSEVVVIDSGSTDRTREIAAGAGARVIVNAPWPGFSVQRNFAIDAAAHDWILAVDADERISAPLRDEIEAERARGFQYDAYRMPRVAHYLDRWIRATDWYPDLQIRLFHRRRARWGGSLIHESVQAQGPVGRLRSPMEHYPYADISEHIRKIDSYTTLWAKDAFANGKRTNVADLLAAPSWTFFRNYVVRGGFLLGQPGLTISILNSFYVFLKRAKLAELARTGHDPARPQP